MEFKAVDLVEFAKAQEKNGAAYWYGTFGQKCTEDLWNDRKAMYPKQYPDARLAEARKHIAANKRCFDCHGLFKGFIFDTLQVNYDPKYDIDCDRAKELSKKSGTMRTFPYIVGLAVWKKGHIGIYIGDGYVIEAKGFNYGVVKTELTAGTWTHWFEHPFINYYFDSDKINPDQEIEVTFKDGFKAITTGSYLNIRANADINSTIVGHIFKKDTLVYIEYLSKDGKWGHTDIGWISTDYLRKVD